MYSGEHTYHSDARQSQTLFRGLLCLRVSDVSACVGFWPGTGDVPVVSCQRAKFPLERQPRGIEVR